MTGAGTNELVGITGRSGVTTWARGTVDNNAVALFKAMNGQRGSFLGAVGDRDEPDQLADHEAADRHGRAVLRWWPVHRRLRGPQGPVGQSSQVAGAQDSLWGMPVVVTTAIGSGTAFVGAFKTAAQLFRRSGVTRRGDESPYDDFSRTWSRSGPRSGLALAVYRPAAFTLVTGLS